MAEITRQRQGELVRGVFEILLAHPEGMPAATVLQTLEQEIPPTAFENSMYPKRPNDRRYEKIVRFSTIGAVKAGWLVKDKGQWSLTAEGRTAFDKFSDPVAFMQETSRLYRAWKKEQPDTDNDSSDDGGEASATFEEAEESAWADIREYLGQMPPYDFQSLVAALLKAMGYYVLWIAPPGPDRGVDMIAYNDPLGTTSPRIKVQVKRQPDTKIGRDGISSFVGTLGTQDVGIYVSAGGFSGDAEREARSQEQRRLTLIDLDRLVKLWIEHADRLDSMDRQRLPLRPIHFLSPPE